MNGRKRRTLVYLPDGERRPLDFRREIFRQKDVRRERSPDRKMSITLGGKETVDGLLDPESFQGFPKVFYGSRALLKDRHNLEGF